MKTLVTAFGFFFALISTSMSGQIVENEKSPISMEISFLSNNNTTATYSEIIQFYQNFAENKPQIQVSEFGITDSGNPLHEVVFSLNEEFDPVKIHESGKAVLFINNAIHPGEPCGVEASMLLLDQLINDQQSFSSLENLVIVIVPVYNIGGALNRNSHTRANQVGPEAYGFRGNAKNLDLNRDFIKCDSKNARSFNQLFNKWNPHVLIDTHTSNGADYQYTMTLIPTQKDKLDPVLSEFLVEEMLPDLYDQMLKKDWEMTPYVYARSTPDEGIYGFMDLPRYSSGYAALRNVISFMPETHMLKPYKDRVLSTQAFLHSSINFMASNYASFVSNKEKAIANQRNQEVFDLNWTLDEEKVEELEFKGYQATYKPSAVTGQDRLYYDHEKPYTKTIKFFNSYKSSLSVNRPYAYIIPQAYTDVIERLKWNNVQISRLDQDQTFDVEMYYIEDYESRDTPYEGHFLHSNVSLSTVKLQKKFFKGDYLVKCDQESIRYIIETLEPNGPDSFFAWNFFDGILMQKEYFSAYVFEDTAAKLLEEDEDLKRRFESKKLNDPEFAKNARAQLRYIYENSGHYEKTFKRYPAARMMSK